MVERSNQFLETLLYLEQFYGDGELHLLEEFFEGVPKKAKENVLYDLYKDGFILTEGGMTTGGPVFMTLYQDGSSRNIDLPINITL
ncbi:hypothetical protein [uncultured Pontibacter sp.]|uniref:hypothetical protein n=1 Tax=uncultured Pontibacter sp. TaxID=453356 RepID=UPI0026305E39|nr:hypothetical protein [uncultured Pontibacter sp.]